MKKLLLLVALLTISAGCNTQTTERNIRCSGTYNSPLSVASQNLCVQIISSAQDKEKGLSGRDNMETNQGMLFDFSSNPSAPSFWMKDMKFDLDLIWISNNKIISITKNAR